MLPILEFDSNGDEEQNKHRVFVFKTLLKKKYR